MALFNIAETTDGKLQIVRLPNMQVKSYTEHWQPTHLFGHQRSHRCWAPPLAQLLYPMPDGIGRVSEVLDFVALLLLAFDFYLRF